ncbi:hypothetical protein A6R68_20759 [Neotoma lepida]|uniref:Uncharacterized protein n=1 Tax=Neotoma lepida TaxID=56216 RepID=A0A1A6HRZ5_NEOLE|nr:hypothetical protein A6R68_20759 [Neotoma lepida]
MGMVAGAPCGTFSYLRIGMQGRELTGSTGKTMTQSGGGAFGTFTAIRTGTWRSSGQCLPATTNSISPEAEPEHEDSAALTLQLVYPDGTTERPSDTNLQQAPRWKSMRLSPKGGSSGGSAENSTALATSLPPSRTAVEAHRPQKKGFMKPGTGEMAVTQDPA